MRRWDGQLAWSAAGDQIMALGYPPGDAMNAIFLVPADGGEVTRVTDKAEDRYYKEGFAWHPDEDRVAWMCCCEPEQTRLSRLDGSPSEVLIDRDGSWDWVGTWTPDGSRYLFLGFGRERGLFTLDPDTGEIRFLSPATGLPVFLFSGRGMVWAAPGPP